MFLGVIDTINRRSNAMTMAPQRHVLFSESGKQQCNLRAGQGRGFFFCQIGKAYTEKR